MSRAIVTLAVGEHEPLLDIALDSFAAFAERHGHDLLVTHPGETRRPPAWGKVLALQHALSDHDEALWLDADTVIVDPSEDLHAPAECWQALVAHHTRDGTVPNTGVWLVRQAMAPVLTRMWAMTGYIHHGWWEQAALLELMGYTGRPVHAGAPNVLEARTHYLDAGWNVHVNDTVHSERARIMHATMHPDRAAVMRQWAHTAAA